ncbi:MAG: ParB N-terminal domain-containing protein [Spirochaetia bacterium]|jgi:ParB family chromosome partitioning protein|nr:ParB N-terminal domain-containing protein [Spirochaetia bacterium]
MLVRISEIQIKKRIRKEIGNINELVESMNIHGLMNPIVLTREYQLIAGFRRLQSAKKLGWENIEANIIDATTNKIKLEIEIEENIHRKDFTPDEIVDAYTKLEKLKNPCFFKKILINIIKFFKKIFKP